MYSSSVSSSPTGWLARSKDLARSLAIWTGFAGVTVVAVPPMVIGYPLVLVDPNRAISDAYLRTLARVLVRLNPGWQVEVQGLEHLDRGGPYVIVVNHQSLFDLMVTSFLHHPIKYLGKRAVFDVPVFGWALRIAGEVPVERGDRASGSRALGELRRWLQRGVSVCLFPEGTRSVDGKVAPFKLGAFRLAVETRCPILPVVISGARDLLPKHSVVFQRHAEITMRVLPPVPTVRLDASEVPELAERVRGQMIETLAELEERVP